MTNIVVVAVVLLAVCSAFPFPVSNDDDVTVQLTSLFSMDSNKAKDSQVTVEYQNMASKAHPDHDNAPKPLFNVVDNSLLTQTTYAAFKTLKDTFTTPDVDTADPLTSTRQTAFNAYIDSISKTNVYISAWNYLTGKGIASTDDGTFRQQLANLWLTPYARNSVVGSSGFESVFAGETSGSSVVRFNNWVAFAMDEAAGQFNYHGWLTRNKGVDLELQWMWGQQEAISRSFLLNASPEAEFMAYTVCALATSGQCTATIGGVTLAINTVTKTVGGIKVIDECYPGAGASPTSGPHPSKAPPANDADLQATVDKMRAADSDKATSYVLNWGSKVSKNNDVSKDPLFTSVDESIFTRPVYQKLITIYEDKLFTPDTCTSEPPMTGFRLKICRDWLDTMANTTVFNLAYQYLQSQGKATTINALKDHLFMLWFGTYGRCSHDKSIKGSSGWEHVYSGEWKGNTVDGHHNWVNYYRQEKAGDINYYGYFSYDKQVTGTFQYKWDAAFKEKGGFLIGTSPAFDFSLLSICVMVHPNGSNCKFNLDGFPMGVTSYTEACDAGTCIATAYPTN